MMSEPALLTVKQASARWNVSEETIRRWARAGRINYREIGPFRLKRIAVADVERVIEPAAAPVPVAAMPVSHTNNKKKAKR